MLLDVFHLYLLVGIDMLTNVAPERSQSFRISESCSMISNLTITK